jgi:DNA-binding MarR family transcriptional regulator
MVGLLSREIKQTKPFASAELEAYLNLCRTADAIQRETNAVLRARGLTAAQYNVLRILRGAGAQGLSCSELGSRLVTFDPDVTRLLDKLEARGLVQRQRDLADRRVVVTSLTPAGAALVADRGLDEALLACHRRQFAPLHPEQVTLLIDLLERLRQPSPSTPDQPVG